MATKQPRPDKPHAGVDRRRNDMTGRKYKGTRWDAQPDELRPAPVTPPEPKVKR